MPPRKHVSCIALAPYLSQPLPPPSSVHSNHTTVAARLLRHLHDMEGRQEAPTGRYGLRRRREPPVSRYSARDTFACFLAAPQTPPPSPCAPHVLPATPLLQCQPCSPNADLLAGIELLTTRPRRPRFPTLKLLSPVFPNSCCHTAQLQTYCFRLHGLATFFSTSFQWPNHPAGAHLAVVLSLSLCSSARCAWRSAGASKSCSRQRRCAVTWSSSRAAAFPQRQVTTAPPKWDHHRGLLAADA